MRAILPGKPQARLQALCTTEWEGLRLVVRKFGSLSEYFADMHGASFRFTFLAMD